MHNIFINMFYGTYPSTFTNFHKTFNVFLYLFSKTYHLNLLTGRRYTYTYSIIMYYIDDTVSNFVSLLHSDSYDMM